MKVLKKKSWAWVFTCEGCGSKLEAEMSDVEIGYFNGSYCEEGDREYCVSCPECGELAIVPETKLTTAVTNAADKKGDDE